MTIQYTITPDEAEYLIRMILALLAEQRKKNLD